MLLFIKIQELVHPDQRLLVLALNFTVGRPDLFLTRSLLLRRLRSIFASGENWVATRPATTMRKKAPKTKEIGFSKFMSKGAGKKWVL